MEDAPSKQGAFEALQWSVEQDFLCTSKNMSLITKYIRCKA
jgi:hypothetical protein